MKESKNQLKKKYILKSITRIVTSKYKDAANQICYEIELLFNDEELLQMNEEESFQKTKEYMDKKYGANQFHFDFLYDSSENIIGIKYRCNRDWEMRVLFNMYSDLILDYNVKKRYFDFLKLTKSSFKKQHVNNMQQKITELESELYTRQSEIAILVTDKKELLKKIMYELKCEDKLIVENKKVTEDNKLLQQQNNKLIEDNSKLLKQIYELENNGAKKNKIAKNQSDQGKTNQDYNKVQADLIKISQINGYDKLSEFAQKELIKNESELIKHKVDQLEELIKKLIKYNNNIVLINAYIKKFLKGDKNV